MTAAAWRRQQQAKVAAIMAAEAAARKEAADAVAAYEARTGRTSAIGGIDCPWLDDAYNDTAINDSDGYAW